MVRRISKATFKKAAVGSGGIKATIAKRIKVSRMAITKFVQKHPELEDLLEQERQKVIDVAENRLYSAAERGEKWAVNKILSTLGKDRGFVEKQEIEHKGKTDFNIQVNIPESVKEIINQYDSTGNKGVKND